MKKVVKSFKKQLKPAREHPIIALGCTLFVLLLIGGLTTLVIIGAGDDSGGDKSASNPTKTDDGDSGAGNQSTKPRKRLDEAPPAPVVKSAGTLDVARRVGRFAIAQARGKIENPQGVGVRVSAAPKQPVTVDYQISCYELSNRKGVTKVAQKRYRTIPPDERDLPLPLTGADECLVTVGVQLTKGSGRVKVAVLAR